MMDINWTYGRHLLDTMDDADSLWVTLGGNVLLSLYTVTSIDRVLFRMFLSIADITHQGRKRVFLCEVISSLNFSDIWSNSLKLELVVSLLSSVTVCCNSYI